MIPTSTIPRSPGVYLFKDKYNTIIYIGKAKNLRKRVSSYFRKSNHAIKTQLLVKNIKDAEFILVQNEIEALLLENKLIKKHKPKYNINLKDAKTYAYIMLTEEKYPKILTTRRVTKRGDYYGPYTDGSARKEIQHLCIGLFKLRTCKTLPKRACLNYHINLCTAPCIGNVDEKEYGMQVAAASQFLKGNTKPTIKRLEKEMKEAAKIRKYEIALEKKRQIDAINHLHEKQTVDLIKSYDQHVVAIKTDRTKAAIVLFSIKKGVISGKKEYRFDWDEELLESFLKMYYSQNDIPHEVIINAKPENKEEIETYLTHLKGQKVKITLPQRGEKVSLVKLAEKNAKHNLENTTLKQIQEKLNLPSIPYCIECFDISNLSYEHIVGAMTQWVDGKPNKQGYRKFEIKTRGKNQDDFAAMREVVSRRYKRLRDEKQAFPDLIIIDGGKGQLSSAVDALEELGLKIPIVGLAKKEEEIFLPKQKTSRKYDQNSPMMLLIREIRNSVHRFVLSYNRKKRQMKFRDQTKD